VSESGRSRPLPGQNAETAEKDFWSILRYDDIVAVSKAPAIFSSSEGLNLERVILEETAGSNGPNLIQLDPPEPVRYRNAHKAALSPKRLRSLEPGIRERTAALLDRIEPNSEIDLVASLSAELPIRILATLFGTPEEDWKRIFHQPAGLRRNVHRRRQGSNRFQSQFLVGCIMS